MKIPSEEPPTTNVEVERNVVVVETFAKQASPEPKIVETQKTPEIPIVVGTTELKLDGDTNGVEVLFREWQRATGHHRALLDPKRRKLIAKFLDKYGIDECRLALKGISEDPWRQERKGSTGIEHWLRLENFDRYREAAREKQEQESGSQWTTDRVYERFSELALDWTETFGRTREDMQLREIDPAWLAKFDERFRPAGVYEFRGSIFPWFAEDFSGAMNAVTENAEACQWAYDALRRAIGDEAASEVASIVKQARRDVHARYRAELEIISGKRTRVVLGAMPDEEELQNFMRGEAHAQ